MKKMLSLESPPMFSVVIAVRNASHELERTLYALQPMYNSEIMEIILIDGSSTDGIDNVLQKFSNMFSIVVSEPDEGIADAWNKGVSHSSGRWITFLSAGDFLHPLHFIRAQAALENTENFVAYCDVIKFDLNNEVRGRINGTAPTKTGIVRGSIGFAHPGSFTRRDAIEKIGGFDKKVKIAIDTDFLLRCFHKGLGFMKFDSCAYMSMGGVSDYKFGEAITEFYSAAKKLGFVTDEQASRYIILLPAVRVVLHFWRRWFFSPMRALKHLAVAALNLGSKLIPFHNLRWLYFRLLGFKLASKATLGIGFKFYRLGNLNVGKNSIVNRDCLIDNRELVQIGTNVSIARNVQIFTAGHDPDSPFFELVSAPVTIKDHSVIFAGAKIMPGVTIGEGAVVYTGSIVTRDIPDRAIVAGAPAKVIRKRLSNLSYELNYPFPHAM